MQGGKSRAATEAGNVVEEGIRANADLLRQVAGDSRTQVASTGAYKQGVDLAGLQAGGIARLSEGFCRQRGSRLFKRLIEILSICGTTCR
jgi:hypothetical protein